MPRSTKSSSSSLGEVESRSDSIEQEDDMHTYLIPVSPSSVRHPQPRHVPSRNRLADERTGLLNAEDPPTSYATLPQDGLDTPRPFGSRQNSFRRRGSFSMRLVNALGNERRNLDSSMHESKSIWKDGRVWYDQFTSTDWVQDSIADAYRVKALRARKDLRGRLEAWLDGAQGWILVALVGCLTASVAFFTNVTESTLYDYKEGHCERGWWMNRKRCCEGASMCDDWTRWGELPDPDAPEETKMGFITFTLGCVICACLSCWITLGTKTVIPSTIKLSTLDENLGADVLRHSQGDQKDEDEDQEEPAQVAVDVNPPVTYYSAAGSGVAEVKVILSGFVLHGYLGVRTLVLKTLGLILSVASGLSLGKEGPYVHIAASIGNIACRVFSKYNHNDGKRREVLSASAAAGVAVAFGAPIGGVLFSLEEVSYYFPPKTLFRTFFCCIAAALSLKFLDPYGTGKIVLFEVRYMGDWQFFELFVYIIVGILGGILGALFIKACRIWARTFRRIPAIKKYPMLEVFLVALITGIVSYWNRYTKIPVAELLFELASPCDTYSSSGTSLCPTRERIPEIIGYLFIAFIVKALLTVITFGIKVPAGIYVPSMVVGGLMGRMVGHGVQYVALNYASTGLFGTCDANDGPEQCVVPGVYALLAAGATMTGVTRLTVTLAIILFELTGSLNHVLPFSLGILVAKWTADAIEPLSIYDLLTDMNSYPFLDNKKRPIFTSELEEITPRIRLERIIDVSESPLVHATELRRKLEFLQLAGELDGGICVVRDHILIGLIPAPDLEFALDKLPNEENSLCLVSTRAGWSSRHNLGEEEEEVDPTDFTHYIDPSPVALDIHSPMDLVYECFVKLGLRYICVLRDGQFAGLVHKKAFVQYIRELEAKGGH